MTLSDELFGEILTTKEAAAFIRCSTQRLEIWRTKGGGPPFVKMGRMVRYRRSTLLEWMAEREINNTSTT